MAKTYKTRKSSGSGYKQVKEALRNEGSEQYKDRNLAAINPLTEQFAPTDANPISQHKNMAGC